MRLRRILAAAVVTTLAAPTALLTTATEASAATATHIASGWIKPSSSYHTQPGPMVYGDSISLAIKVLDPSNNTVYEGSLKVQRQLPGKAWTTIKTTSSSYLYDTIKAVGNAKYRVLYSGTSSYAPSGAGVTASVQRKITFRDAGGDRVLLVGKVAPRYHGKVTILKKAGKRWKRYKVLKTNRRSQFKTPLPAPRRGKYYWKIQIAASRTFAKSQTGTFYTYTT